MSFKVVCQSEAVASTPLIAGLNEFVGGINWPEPLRGMFSPKKLIEFYLVGYVLAIAIAQQKIV
jgi:hypothetical protein